VEEFAVGGIHATPTASIAARAGVSQPYLFRLFAGKRDLFLAAAEYGTGCAVRAFQDAAEGMTGEAALVAGERAWSLLVVDHQVFALQVQLHAAAASDAVIRAAAVRQWALLWGTVAAATRLPGPELECFFGRMLLLHTVTTLTPGPALLAAPGSTGRGSRAVRVPGAVRPPRADR
jgi:AcrR family transcriptional regulator